MHSWIDAKPVQIALRTYALSLSLSLGPSLIPFITASLTSKSSPRTGLQALKRVLRRELGLDGFAFAITLSLGGGAAINDLWRAIEESTPKGGSTSPQNRIKTLLTNSSLSPIQKTCIANAISSYLGILLLQSGRKRVYRLQQGLVPPSTTVPFTPPTLALPSSRAIRTSDTLDLTLLLLVRAVDALLQTFIRHNSETVQKTSDTGSLPNSDIAAVNEKSKLESHKLMKKTTSQIDAFVFWACSARIMWCFFYEPERLPRSYVKWIATLANLDGRVIKTLRLIREGRWSYIRGSKSHSDVLTGFAKELGHSASLGDPAALPAYGGATADQAWKILGVKNRPGVGGLPCEIVHGTVGSSLGLEGSCTVNSSIRAVMAFLEAIAIYLPVHFLPILLTRPQSLLKPHHALATLFGALRSATFLSSFVTLYWYTVCVTRSLVLARLFPFISHDFWDGPFGCVLAGCLVCGSSIWIENGRRRGEMALYVLPRAVRASLPDAWIRHDSKKARIAERLTFILSFSTLIGAAIHRPETLRGLSRWTLSFIMNGPNAGFWKRKRQSSSTPSTPTLPPALTILENSVLPSHTTHSPPYTPQDPIP